MEGVIQIVIHQQCAGCNGKGWTENGRTCLLCKGKGNLDPPPKK